MNDGPYDIIVIGAGPAGAMAAREMARRGRSVLLVDKARFPRDKACGCCINAYALATLAAAGLGGLCAEQGALPVRSFRFVAGRREAAVAMTCGVCLSRRRFDEALVHAAIDAGVTFWDGVMARVEPEEAAGLDDGYSRVMLKENGTVSPGPPGNPGKPEAMCARVVIVADGVGGRSLDNVPGMEVKVDGDSYIGVAATLDNWSSSGGGPQPGEIVMRCVNEGYMGSVVLEGGNVRVAAALHPSAIRAAGRGRGADSQGGPAAACAAILRHTAATNDAAPLYAATWRGTAALTRRRCRVVDDRLFVIGDAAGYVEPFTGEGIGWALACGVGVADPVEMALTGASTEAAKRWMARYRELMAARRRRCRSITWALRQPALRVLGMRSAQVFPGIARRVVQRLGR